LDASEEKAGETPAFPGTWSGAAGLAEDVRRYGQWMRDEAFKRIGHLYPPIKVTKAMAKDRPDLEQYVGEELTIIAWLWARTVRSPNPAFSSVEVPLVSTFTLSSREGQESYVAPVIGKMGYQFTVKIGIPSAEAKAGTKASRGNFRCLMSQAPIDGAFLRTEGKAARMGRRLMAIVAEGSKGRVYLSPDIDQETIANTAKPIWKPDVDFFSGGVRIPYRKLWHDKVERSIHPKTTRSLNDI
jgi:putative DNA methylase